MQRTCGNGNHSNYSGVQMNPTELFSSNVLYFVSKAWKKKEACFISVYFSAPHRRSLAVFKEFSSAQWWSERERHDSKWCADFKGKRAVQPWVTHILKYLKTMLYTSFCLNHHITLLLISIHPPLVRNIMITGLLETTGLTDTHTHTDVSVGASSRPGNDGYFSFSTPDIHIDWQPHTETDNLLSSPLLPCRLVWDRVS